MAIWIYNRYKPYLRIINYICDTEKFLKEGTMFLKDNIFAFEMDQNVSVDIDNETDFHYALSLFHKKINLKKIQ